MTPDDLELDPTLIRSADPLKLYRITKAKYANLSGIGAAYAPGRWNRAGQEAIYTSMDPATPQLEYLAHIPKNVIPSDLVLMEIHLRGRREWVEGKEGPESESPRLIRNGILLIPNLGLAKRMFPGIWNTTYAGVYAVAVPSVVARTWNVVLYPAGVGFWDYVSLETIEPFEFDTRLFPENAPLGSA